MWAASPPALLPPESRLNAASTTKPYTTALSGAGITKKSNTVDLGARYAEAMSTPKTPAEAPMRGV